MSWYCKIWTDDCSLFSVIDTVQTNGILHLHLHLLVHKKLAIHYSRTGDSRTGYTRHVSALTVT